MRFIRYAVWALIALVLIALALGNRGNVTLRLMPSEAAALLGYPEGANTISLPLFLVIFLGVVIGLLIGFTVEWLREHKHRAEAARNRREAKRLEREVAAMKSDKNEGDDVLALLDDASAAR